MPSKSDQALLVLCESTIKICEALERVDHPAALFKAASTRLYIASILLRQLEEASLQHQLVIVKSTLERICPSRYKSWQEFAPILALKMEVLQTECSEDADDHQKAATFVTLSERARELDDFSVERSCRIAAINHAQAAHSKKPTALSLEVLKEANSRFLKLERSLQHGFFLAYGLVRTLTQSAVSDRRWGDMKVECDQFFQSFPEMELPRVMQMLTYYAMSIADANGDQRGKEDFKERWITVSAASPQKRYYDQIFSKNMAEQATKAVTVMLAWAKDDIDGGVLEEDRANQFFAFVPAFRNERRKIRSWRLSNEDARHATAELFGLFEPVVEPRTDESWKITFEPIKKWLLLEPRDNEREKRHFLLKALHACRAWLVRSSFEATRREPTSLDFQRLIILHQDHREILNAISPVVVTDGDRALLRHEKISQALTASFVNDAIESGISTDAVLQEALAEGEALAQYYADAENQFKEHSVCKTLGRIQLQRFIRFRSCPPDACLSMFVKADSIYNSMRNERSILSPSASLTSKSKTADIHSQEEVYMRAILGARLAYMMSLAQMGSQTDKQTYMDNTVMPRLNTLIDWVILSKARGLSDLLGIEARIPERMRADAKMSSFASDILSLEESLVSKLRQSSQSLKKDLQKDLENLHAEMRKEPSLAQILQLRQGTLTAGHTLMLDLMHDIGKGVVFIDWLDSPTGIQVLIYKDGQRTAPQPVKRGQDVFLMNTVENWITANLVEQRPLQDLNTANAALEDLSPLVYGAVQFSNPGEVLIFCPTKALHRVPLHALPYQGRPLIERNPIVYTQSLPVLQLCRSLVHEMNSNEPVFQPVVLNPMPEEWKNPPRPVLSTETVRDIATSLNAKFLHGESISKDDALSALAGASLVHYHGHVDYQEAHPLECALVLDRDTSSKPQAAKLTAAEFFDLRLSKPAHVNIIGCASGRARVSRTDDLLGLVPSLYYAGASSVISTLWPIGDEDGSKFSRLFFNELQQQRLQQDGVASDEIEGKSKALSEAPSVKMLDLAKATQKAILRLKEMRTSNGFDRTPYNWAAFQLNGYWMYPSSIKTKTL